MRSLFWAVLTICTIAATASVVPAALMALWDVSAPYRDPERFARFEQIRHRSDEATLRLCDTFSKLYAENPAWGPFPSSFAEVCGAALNRK